MAKHHPESSTGRDMNLRGGILIGGKSRRLGWPKQLMRQGNCSLLARLREVLAPYVAEVVLLGSGELPPDVTMLRTLPDVPGVCGPLSGVLAAMRWASSSSWIVCACDMPQISAAAVEWLLAARSPETWAVIPKLPDKPGCEPLFAYYDARAVGLLEELAGRGEWRLSALADLPQVATPVPPASLRAAWMNVNTLEDLQADGTLSFPQPELPR